MFVFSVAFVLGFLSSSEAVLPNVGSCTVKEYLCDALKCNTDFIKKLQKDPNGDCSAKYNKMVSCVKSTIKICVGDTLSESSIDRIIGQNFKENTLCYEGALETPTMPAVGSPCSSSFSADAHNCVKTFHQKFAADKSDPFLCAEQANAKKCLKKLIATECTLLPAAQEILDLGLSDYNPFCANNRDPGATGNDMCYGVKPLQHNAAASGMKSTALQALLFACLLMLFFVKA